MKNKYYSLRKLNKIKNLKGEILLGLKKSDPEYKNFSEFYFSKIFINIWHNYGTLRNNCMVYLVIILWFL